MSRLALQVSTRRTRFFFSAACLDELPGNAAPDKPMMGPIMRHFRATSQWRLTISAAAPNSRRSCEFAAGGQFSVSVPDGISIYHRSFVTSLLLVVRSFSVTKRPPCHKIQNIAALAALRPTGADQFDFGSHK
jgi:hypothetical protein